MGIFEKVLSRKIVLVSHRDLSEGSDLPAIIRETLGGEPESFRRPVVGMTSYTRESMMAQVPDEGIMNNPYRMLGKVMDGLKFRRKKKV